MLKCLVLSIQVNILGGNKMNIVLVIVHVVISVALIATVLMQHGKQQGLSGAIAGGAETFFGKNKGRTIDAVLKKVTAVLAVLFVVSSLILTASAVKQSKPEETPVQEEVVTDENAGTQVEASLDENGNLVDAEGNVIATAEQLQSANEGDVQVEVTPENEAE